MRTATATLTVLALAGMSAYAQQAPSVGQPQTTPGAAVAGPAAPPVVARVFAAGAGLLFNVVRPDRVVDFEMVMGYLQSALEKSTDPTVRAQARGWRVFKAAEPGPNNTVIYVFLIDPTVAGADYGLGRILSDAYPEQIQDIWKLYTGSLAGGGSILNLAPVQPSPSPVPLPPTPEQSAPPVQSPPPPVQSPTPPLR